MGFSEAEKELIGYSEYLGVDLVGLGAADKLGVLRFVAMRGGKPYPQLLKES